MEDESMASFVNLLASLSLPDNEVRTKAEQQYEALKGHPDGFLPFSLLKTIVDATVAPHIRKLAAVLLRRILLQDENSAYSELSEGSQVEFRTQLLHALDNEADAYLKARVTDIVGELANFVIDEWPEILPYTHHCLQSLDSLQKETGLTLLSLLGEQVASLLCNGDSIETMLPILEQCLVDSSSEGRIMLSALRALAAILACVAQPSDIERFQGLLAPLLSGLQMLLQWEDGEAAALSFAETMIELAEDCVVFYEGQLDLLFASISACVTAESGVSTPLRHMFMELLVTLCGETTKKVRKLRGPEGQKGYFVLTMVPVCVSMMVSVPDDPNWSLSESSEEEDAEDVMDCDVGETSLDRICRELGLTATWAVVSAQFTHLLQSRVWQHCHAGLRCLGNYMEVSKNINNKKQLRQHVMDMALLVLPFMKHNHDRVRAAAYYAFGQFITMHGRGQGLDASQIDQTIPLLIEGLPVAVNPSARVRRSALVALSNTVDVCPASVVQQHAGAILQAVAFALAEGPVIVQEMCVAVIIGLAETSEGAVLCEYYDAIIPVLKQLLAHSMTNGLESLWGQGMECCAMVGEASGKEKFYPDALEMMNSLVAMGNELEEGSAARTYLMKAWVRIARCLGSDFLPFLPLVMAQLIAAIQQDVTAEAVDPEELETRSDIHMVEMESGWVAVRTAAVEEQSSACQLVMLMVEKLQEHFYPYVETTVNAIAPLLESPHEDVRSFCMVAIPELVRCTAKAMSPDRTALINLTEYFVGLLVKSIESESSLELIMTGLQALRATFSYACTDWTTHVKGMGEPAKLMPATSIRFLNTSQMEAITQCATLVLRDSLQRRAILRAEAQCAGGGADEDDAGDEALFLQNCMELHFNLAELIGTVFRTHGSDFSAVYRQIWHETVIQMTHVNCLKEDRQFGFFIISDVIEFGLTNETVEEYLGAVMASVLAGCEAEEEGIRQTSVYCVGIAAELFPTAYLPYAAQSLTALSGAIAMGDGEEERGMSTDNAVSSVGILLEQMEAALAGTSDALSASFPFVWGEWLAYLPLRDDVEEGSRVLRQLTKLLRSRHATLFCSLERVEQAVVVLLEVLGSDLVGPEVTREVVHTLQLMRVGESLLGAGGMEQLCAKLAPELGAKLRQYLSMDFSSPLESSSPQAPAPIHDVLMRF